MASPKLRFKEFDSEWTLQNLGSLFSKRRDKGISGVPTYSVTLNNGIVNRDDLERDTPTNLSPQEHLLVKKNDLAYNMMRMWQGALGLAPTDGIVSPAYVVLKPSEQKTNSNFFEYYFKKNRQIHNFWAYSQGLTEDRLRLYFDDFKVIKINAPSKEEQTKIASFLSAVDEKIAQLTQKHELLSQYKQGMIQKLFSQQIRFKADDGSEFGEWEEKLLSEIGTFKNGLNKDKESFGFGFPFVNLMDVFGKQIVRTDSLGLVDATDRDLENYSLKKGDVLFIRSSVKAEGVGQTVLVDKDLKNVVYSGFLIRFRDSYGLDLGFKKYCFMNNTFRLKLLAKSTTSANTNINQESLYELSIDIPCLEEQTKIANFLAAIDQKIEVVAKQIEHAKQLKKGLLQQMFV